MTNKRIEWAVDGKPRVLKMWSNDHQIGETYADAGAEDLRRAIDAMPGDDQHWFADYCSEAERFAASLRLDNIMRERDAAITREVAVIRERGQEREQARTDLNFEMGKVASLDHELKEMTIDRNAWRSKFLKIEYNACRKVGDLDRVRKEHSDLSIRFVELRTNLTRAEVERDQQIERADRLERELKDLKHDRSHEHVAGLRRELDEEREKVARLMQPVPGEALEGGVWKMLQLWQTQRDAEKRELREEREKSAKLELSSNEWRGKFKTACEKVANLEHVIRSQKFGLESAERALRVADRMRLYCNTMTSPPFCVGEYDELRNYTRDRKFPMNLREEAGEVSGSDGPSSSTSCAEKAERVTESASGSGLRSEKTCFGKIRKPTDALPDREWTNDVTNAVNHLLGIREAERDAKVR